MPGCRAVAQQPITAIPFAGMILTQSPSLQPLEQLAGPKAHSAFTPTSGRLGRTE
jgi:hypothetical protein